jgi:hypothetical protein
LDAGDGSKARGLNSNQPGIKKNADGSVTLWFAPEAQAGQEANWVQTTPGQKLELAFAALRPVGAVVQ